MRGNKPERRLVCEACGEGFTAKNRRNGDVICPRCRGRQAKQRAKRRKTMGAAKSSELAAVAARARTANMTYGQYVAGLSIGS